MRKPMKKQERGFTLVELAIVLVIIGIILGAVMKGQDLIKGARIKRFISKVREWETAQWIYYDRYGRFAGDNDSDGIIEGDVKADLTGADFIYPPYGSDNSNAIRLGSNTFYVFFGNDNGTKNIMVICADPNCGTFDNDSLDYVKAFDTTMDGAANGTAGQVVGFSGTTLDEDTNTWLANGTISSLSDYDSGINAVIYYFDAKRQ